MFDRGQHISAGRRPAGTGGLRPLASGSGGRPSPVWRIPHSARKRRTCPRSGRATQRWTERRCRTSRTRDCRKRWTPHRACTFMAGRLPARSNLPACRRTIAAPIMSAISVDPRAGDVPYAFRENRERPNQPRRLIAAAKRCLSSPCRANRSAGACASPSTRCRGILVCRGVGPCPVSRPRQ